MFEEDEIRNSLENERRREKAGKYKPLPRNRQTERELKRIFDYGTEAELTKYLRENGVADGSKRFVEIVKLFRVHGGKHE